MKSTLSLLSAGLCCAVVWCATNETRASLVISSGLGTSHTGNLVKNGSFELGAPADGIGNVKNFADPAGPNYQVPPGWLSSGANSATRWGNDAGSPYRIAFSDLLPDGRAGLDFRTSTNVTVDQPPSFFPNGTVTFPAPPNFTSVAGAPVILHQVVHTEAVPMPSYNLSFWVSGEENATNQGNTGVGLLGLIVTNTIAGDPIQWLAAPNVVFYGMSKLYEFQFTPLNPLAPVDVSFINYGALNLAAYGGSPFGTQPILDDVIINGVPEPGSGTLLLAAIVGLIGLGRRRLVSCRRPMRPAWR